MTTTTFGWACTPFTRPSSDLRPSIGKIRIKAPPPGLGDQMDPRRGQGPHHAARRVYRRDEEVAPGRQPGLLESRRVPERVTRVGQRAARQIRIEPVDDADGARHDQEN